MTDERDAFRLDNLEKLAEKVMGKMDKFIDSHHQHELDWTARMAGLEAKIGANAIHEHAKMQTQIATLEDQIGTMQKLTALGAATIPVWLALYHTVFGG